MKIFLKLGISILLLHSSNVFSSEPFPIDSKNLEKFFQSVEHNTQDKVFENNKFSLKGAAYFGKRHRIVKANLDLLAENGKAFVMNPFDDVDLIVKTKEIVTYQNDLSQRWTVEKLNSRIDVDDPRLTKDLKDQLNSMTLNIRSFRHEVKTENIKSVKGNAISPDPYKSQIRSKLYVSGQLTDFNNHYRVLPVDSSAEYYLVIELDPKKRLIRGDSESAKQRRSAHLEFSERLRLEEDREKDVKTNKGESK